MISVRSVVRLMATLAVVGGLGAFGFAGEALAASTPAISTSQQQSSVTVGGSIADQATVSGSTSYACPAKDNANFALNQYLDSGGVWWCTYPINSSSDNGSVYCEYNDATGVLTVDADGGACPQSAVPDGASPTGTVTFNLYDNPSASGTPLFTDTETLSGGSATSAGYTTTASWTDYWVATYNGDSNFDSVTSGAGSERVSVYVAQPAVNSSPSATSVTVGQATSDQVTLSGGYNPTGTVLFRLYPSYGCLGTPLVTDTETVSGGIATSASYTTTATGVDYWVADYNGDSNNATAYGNCDGGQVTVNAPTASISTAQQPASAAVGSSIADQATVSAPMTYVCPAHNLAGSALDPSPTDSGGVWICSYPLYPGESPDPFYCTYSDSTGALVTDADIGYCPAAAPGTSSAPIPTGTVTFNLYDNPGASGTPLFTDTESLSSGTATSAGYKATGGGTAYWVATYNGDSVYGSVSSDPTAEPVTITAAAPSITTSQQPASATVGNSIADKATISGGSNPTGTVTFDLYTNPNCTGTALFADTESLSGGSATSAGYTTTSTGTDYWVATYNGDTNNNTVGSSCSGEPVTITAAAPSITTSQQPASATVGNSIADKATISGGSNPTGTVTFDLYTNPNCTGTALFADTESLSGGSATSAGYTTTSTGTDYWVATYNGDTNNNTVGSSCSGEPVTISPVSLQSQSITFNQPLGPYVIGTESVSLTATASSGLPVRYTASGPCHMTGGKLTLTAVGVCTVIASQAGDSTYAAAQSVTRQVVIEYGISRLTPTSGARFRHGASITVTFVLTDSSGKPVAASAANALSRLGGVQVVLSGPSISQTAACGWQRSTFVCTIHAPNNVRTGLGNPYRITAREDVGAGFLTIPPIHAAQDPVTIYFT